MIIQRIHIGEHGKRTVYVLCLDIKDTGKELQELARFDKFETATAVLRYIRGDNLSKDDILKAREAIQRIDAINES